jgi:hypothetical protein
MRIYGLSPWLHAALAVVIALAAAGPAAGSAPAPAAPSAGAARPASVEAAEAAEPAVSLSAGSEPKLWVTPLALDFGPVGVSQLSTGRAITVTNTGTAALSGFAPAVLTSPFGYAGHNCGSSLAPGASCRFLYSFLPIAAGTYTTTHTVGTNAGSFNIQLRGTGVARSASVSPLALDFGWVQPPSFNSESVVVRNTGLSPVAVSAGSVPAPFSINFNTCGASLAAGATCQVNYRFTPTSVSTFQVTPTITVTAGPTTVGVFPVSLLGHGCSAPFCSEGGLRVNPRALDFGPVGVGTYAILQVTIHNQSSSSASFAGGGLTAPFHAFTSCGGGLPAGQSCQLTYQFSPTAASTFTTTAAVQATPHGNFSIALRGTGVAPSVTASPLWLDFGPVEPGVVSPPQEVIIRNTGLVTLTFAGGAAPAPFQGATSCGGGLPPGATCKNIYAFAPTAPGRYTTTASPVSSAGTISIVLQGGEAQEGEPPPPPPPPGGQLLRLFLPLVRR